MPNVSFVREDVRAKLADWYRVRDCLSGSKKIKEAGVIYLPMPNPSDDSDENIAHYDAYRNRAVFYNVVRRTLDGLIGQVFSRDPVVNLPVQFDVIRANIDGAGVSFDQQSKKCLSEVMAYGRCGLLVDYPDRSEAGPASLADLQAGYIRPTVVQYEPWQIINYRLTNIGAKQTPDLIVLSEQYVLSDDGFETKYEDQWRVLRLLNNVYVVEIWQMDKGQAIVTRTYTPLDGWGNPFNEIPFYPMGALNNNYSPDYTPMLDMAELNIGHYRNSADYEEACYMLGQPTPWMSGITKAYHEQVWKGKKVELGSRTVIPLPPEGAAGLLQPAPNTMVFEAMQHKERQMIALGAKLVEQKTVQRTFGEAQLENASESSILAAAAKNVSAAYRHALVACGRFLKLELEDDPKMYELNTDFPASRMTMEELLKVVQMWQAGGIVTSEMRATMRKAGVATKDDEEYKEEKESDDTNRMPDLGFGDKTTPPKQPESKPGDE